MDKRNLTLFLVLATILLVGWPLVERQIWPPKPKPDVTKPKEEPSADPAANAVAALGALANPDGTSSLAALCEPALFGPVAARPVVSQQEPVATPWPWQRSGKQVARDEILSVASLVAGAGNLPDAAETALIGPRKVEVTPVETFHLGDGDYKIQATFTSKGGGLESLTLNQFQAADKWGKPEEQSDGQQVPLTLVPGTDGIPSYLVYHYAQPGDKRPVDTLGNLIWKPLGVKKDERGVINEVTFQADLSRENVRLTKIFTLRPGDYHIGLALRLERIRADGSGLAKFKYQLTGSHGLPIEGQWYTYIFRNALFGWEDEKGGGWRELEDSRQIAAWGGGELQAKGDKTLVYAGVAVQYFASVVAVDNDQPKKDFLEAARSSLETAVMKGKIVGFGSNSITLEVSEKQKIDFRLTDSPELQAKIDKVVNTQVAVIYRLEGDHFLATDIRDADSTNPNLIDDITVRVISEPQVLSGGATEHKFVLYNGPIKVMLLGQLTGKREVSPELVTRYEDTLHLSTLTDYHNPGFMGWLSNKIGWNFLIIKFTNLMHWFLWYIHMAIPVWGLCIIMLTVTVRGIMFPVSRKQVNNQMAMQEKMAKLGPEVRKLEEKFKGDYNALNQAKTELYLRHGVNPLSTMGGCLLMFAQMPIFLGLYYALQESIHFRLNQFLWIDNLAAPDMLFWWGTGIPMLSTPAAQISSMVYLGPFFNLLPILAVSLMIVQQKMMTPPPQDEQQEMQQKMMKYMMLVFGFMFYKVAAGLCIYFIASSLWGLAERKLFPKPTPATPGGGTPPPAGGNGASTPSRPDNTNGRRSGEREEPAEGGFRQRLSSWWSDVLKEAGKQQQARRDPRPEDDGGKKQKKKRRK